MVVSAFRTKSGFKHLRISLKVSTPGSTQPPSPHNLIVTDVVTKLLTDVANHPYRIGSHRPSLYRVKLVEPTHKLKHLSDPGS